MNRFYNFPVRTLFYFEFIWKREASGKLSFVSAFDLLKEAK
jgi:hypothetical protein